MTKKTTKTEVVEENALIEIPQKKELAPAVVSVNPYDKMIEMAITSDASMEKLEKFLELKERHEQNEARKAFYLAMAEFKKTPLHIPKTKKNSQYGSFYTDIGDLVNIALPKLGEHGLSHKWDIKQEGNVITVECFAIHALGFSDSVLMSAPPDKSGSKNPIQEIKSTITYLKAVTFESIFGLASSNANLSDDGNGAGKPKPEVSSLVKLTPEYKALQETKELHPEEYDKMLEDCKGEPETAEQCKMANDYIKALVDKELEPEK